MSASLDFVLFFGIISLVFLYVLIKLFSSIRLIPTQSVHIVERLGKYNKTLEAGFHLLFPFIDKVSYIQCLKEQTIDVPSQECFTKDEVKVEVDGVLYISVIDATKASYGITDYKFASIQLAQTTTRSVVGTLDLDTTFEERETISKKVVSVLEEAGHYWGIKVHRYEIKNLTPPKTVKEAMEKQVTAERERKAIVSKAEGEKQSKINISLGIKQELINRSEGEMQKLINEAEGKAQEILAISKARAESISKIAKALTIEGAEKAMRLDIAESFFNKLKKLGHKDTKVIIPGSLNKMDELLKGFNIEI